MVDFLHPMVPVTIHQVFGRIGLGLGQERVGVDGTLNGAGDRTHKHQLAAVRREGEFTDPLLHVRYLDAPAQFPVLEGGLPDLPALKEKDGVPIRRPTGIRDALAVHRKLGLPTTLDRDGEEIADAAVLRDVGVTHAVEDGLSVGRKLRVGESSEGEQDLRSHSAVLDLQVGRTDVALLGFHVFIFARKDGKNRQCDG